MEITNNGIPDSFQETYIIIRDILSSNFVINKQKNRKLSVG